MDTLGGARRAVRRFADFTVDDHYFVGRAFFVPRREQDDHQCDQQKPAGNYADYAAHRDGVEECEFHVCSPFLDLLLIGIVCAAEAVLLYYL